MKFTVPRGLVQTVVTMLALGATTAAIAQDAGAVDPEALKKVYKAPGYSPYAGRDFPTRVFWGDTHLHTSVSLDAGAAGTTVGPEVAYRFARGDEVTTSAGQ